MPLANLSLRILRTLEEAGEDDVAALLNGADGLTGEVAEVRDYSSALLELVSQGLLVAARQRHEVTRCWIPLAPGVSSELFENIQSCLTWDAKMKFWRWTHETRLRVVLTDDGRAVAERVLASGSMH